MQRLRELWRGQLPLEIAFWHYAIFYGLVFNIIATAAFFTLLILDVPVAIALIVHLSPVPYLILALCGVWRSADRYDGPRSFATFTRIGVVAWFCLWFVA